MVPQQPAGQTYVSVSLAAGCLFLFALPVFEPDLSLLVEADSRLRPTAHLRR